MKGCAAYFMKTYIRNKSSVGYIRDKEQMPTIERRCF